MSWYGNIREWQKIYILKHSLVVFPTLLTYAGKLFSPLAVSKSKMRIYFAKKYKWTFSPLFITNKVCISESPGLASSAIDYLPIEDKIVDRQLWTT